MAEGKKALADIETHNVFTAKPDEPLEVASKRMAQHNISALPVIDIEKKVLGIITSEDVSKLLGTVTDMGRILIRFSEDTSLRTHRLTNHHRIQSPHGHPVSPH